MANLVPITWRDVLTGSLRLLGVPGSGQKPTANQLNNALFSALEILDSWNVQGEMLVSDQLQVFDNIAAGQLSYTIGPGAEFNTPIRPTEINFAAYHYTSSSPPIDIPLDVITLVEYSAIKVKEINSQIPRWITFDYQYPIGNVYFWPLLNQTSSVVLTFPSYFSQVTLDSVFNLPPAYQKVLRFDVACVLAPEYGRPIPQDLSSVVEGMRDNIIANNKRTNQLYYGPECQGVRSKNGLWNALDDQIQ